MRGESSSSRVPVSAACAVEQSDATIVEFVAPIDYLVPAGALRKVLGLIVEQASHQSERAAS